MNDLSTPHNTPSLATTRPFMTHALRPDKFGEWSQRLHRTVLSFLCALGVFFMLQTTQAHSAAKVDVITTPGGLTYWLVSDDTVPVIAVNFAFDGGSAQDSKDKQGVASFMSSLLDEGAGDLDSLAFQTALEDLSVQMSFDATRDQFYGSMRLLTDVKDEAFDLLGMALTKPRFDPEPIERMRAVLLANIRSNINDPDTIVFNTWAKTAYPEHPYSNVTDGTLESIEAITREDIVDFHERIFAKSGLRIVVVGAIAADEASALIDKAFGDLPEQNSLNAVPDAEPIMGEQVFVKQDVPQASLQLGTLGYDRHDEKFFPAVLANHIFGGGSFSSRLFVEVREKRGLVYSVYSYLAPADHANNYVIRLATRNERVGEAMDVIEAERQRMVEEGPTEEELANAKSYLIGSYPLRFDTSSKIARNLLQIRLDGLEPDYMEERASLLEAVTLEQVKEVSRELFARPLTKVVVGAEDPFAGQ